MTSAVRTVDPEELASWRTYTGRSEVRRDVIDVGSLTRFALAVGAETQVEREAPPLAHWAFFADAVASDRLDSDGHSKRGAGVYPPIRLPRRMFAGSAITFKEPLTLGEPAELRITVLDVRRRVGRTGEMVLLDVERRLQQAARERVLERQTIVYREPGARMTPIDDIDRRVRPGEHSWTPTPVELFRFSAATFNAHRIHYDEPYATAVEGYPGLVVHGPLTAIKLFAFAQSRLKTPIRHFSFRALAPLFVNQPAVLTSAAVPNQFECLRCDGAVAMSATVSDLESANGPD